jgi:hypothetical protein
MKKSLLVVVLMSFFIIQMACQSTSDNDLKAPSDLKDNESTMKGEKKSTTMTIDSVNSPTFTPANTSGNFSKGKGSDKKISTEKPNRNRVLQDLTHPLQSPIEFVDETTDPAFHYSNSDGCETILTDTIQ